MNIRKMIPFAAALVLSAGVLSVIPETERYTGNTAVTVSAAESSSDFVIKTDSGGKKYVESYSGSGGDIRIPDGVNYIADCAFMENPDITGVTFPKSCAAVGENSFSFCPALKSIVFEGDACIEAYAFSECHALESVAVKGSIKDRIGVYAFLHCRSLKTVKISKNKYEFGIYPAAFYECASLSSINIPGKCTEIGEKAFMNCFALERLTVPAKTVLEEKSIGYAELLPKDHSVRFKCFAADGRKSGYYYDSTGEVVKVTPKAVTVISSKGSFAEKYAGENGVKFKAAKKK